MIPSDDKLGSAVATPGKTPHADAVESLAELGLVSCYHATTGEAQGAEKSPTFFLYRQLARPFHIDYCFASTSLTANMRVEVGSPQEWLGLSDHMPIVVTVRL